MSGDEQNNPADGEDVDEGDSVDTDEDGLSFNDLKSGSDVGDTDRGDETNSGETGSQSDRDDESIQWVDVDDNADERQPTSETFDEQTADNGSRETSGTDDDSTRTHRQKAAGSRQTNDNEEPSHQSNVPTGGGDADDSSAEGGENDESYSEPWMDKVIEEANEKTTEDSQTSAGTWGLDEADDVGLELGETPDENDDEPITTPEKEVPDTDSKTTAESRVDPSNDDQSETHTSAHTGDSDGPTSGTTTEGSARTKSATTNDGDSNVKERNYTLVVILLTGLTTIAFGWLFIQQTTQPLSFAGFPPIALGAIVALGTVAVALAKPDSGTVSTIQGETVEDYRRPATTIPGIYAVVGYLLATGGIWGLTEATIPLLYPVASGIIGLYLYVTNVSQVWRNTLTRYYLTSTELRRTYQFGLIEDTTPILMENIERTRQYRGTIEGLLGYGNVEVQTAAGVADPGIQMRSIERYKAFMEAIDTRQKRASRRQDSNFRGDRR